MCVCEASAMFVDSICTSGCVSVVKASVFKAMTREKKTKNWLTSKPLIKHLTLTPGGVTALPLFSTTPSRDGLVGYFAVISPLGADSYCESADVVWRLPSAILFYGNMLASVSHVDLVANTGPSHQLWQDDGPSLEVNPDLRTLSWEPCPWQSTKNSWSGNDHKNVPKRNISFWRFIITFRSKSVVKLSLFFLALASVHVSGVVFNYCLRHLLAFHAKKKLIKGRKRSFKK